MSKEMLTVERTAELLDLHVRTVRRYVREGKLKALRIGKQYRITPEDLEAFVGRPIQRPEPVRRHRHLDVSAVVHVDVVSPTLAERVTNMLMAAVKSPDVDHEPLRLETVYDLGRGRLKVILSGSVSRTSDMLNLIAKLTEPEPAHD